MAVDATKVRELREKTGLPMMDCKNALEENDGDIDRSIEALRKAGAKAQEKLAGRKAKEGRVAFRRTADGRIGALVALRCETEPVANNEKFVDLANQLVEVVASGKPTSAEALLGSPFPAGGTVGDSVTELVNHMRENISVGSFAYLEGDAVGCYVHFDNKKAAIVALEGGSVSDEQVEHIGRDLCMHVVFHRPLSLSRDKLEPGLIAKEREIRLAAAKNDPKNAKKPENIIEKIIEGQMNKICQEQCFLEQPFIRDDKVSVRDYLKQGGTALTITDFAYVATDD